MTGQDILKEMLAKHPKVPSMTLARILREKYPHQWETLNAAACAVRYARGNRGSKCRKDAADKSKFRKNGKALGIKIPAGFKQVLPPQHFNDAGKWLVISDLHVPYHDETAVEASLRYGIDHGCEHIAINGDYYDFYKLSTYSQNPAERNPDQELEDGEPMLGDIAKQFKGRKVFKVGNHEDRYERYMWSKAPAMAGIADFKLDKVLKLADHGYEYIASKQHYYLGRLAVFHGHELPRGLTNPVNIGRGVFLRLSESALVGHWHKTSTHIETSGLKTRTVTCYSTGCLCGLAPDYAPINSWNHGFAIVTVGKDGDWNVANRTIDRGKVYATE